MDLRIDIFKMDEGYYISNERVNAPKQADHCYMIINNNKIIFDNYIIGFEIIENKNKVEFSKDSLIKLFDYDNIEKEIVIRYRKDGDKIVPLGMNGSKKLKDIFIDLKIPRENRNNIPILCFDDKISWIVGYKTSQLFKVTKDTKKILKITFDRKE